MMYYTYGPLLTRTVYSNFHITANYIITYTEELLLLWLIIIIVHYTSIYIAV